MTPGATLPRTHVALVRWTDYDELAIAIAHELEHLGHRVTLFPAQAELPPDAGLVLTFAPYGPILPIARRAAALSPRPPYVHWNFEGIPADGLPWPLLTATSRLRSSLDDTPWLARSPLAPLWNNRMFRYRYVGDSLYARRRGWLTLLATINELQARFLTAHGLRAEFVPWGTSPDWYADLGLERDIDVLWFGKRRDAYRSATIEMIREGVTARGYKMLVIDGVEHPFVFGPQRSEILNRTRIVLNAKPRARGSTGFTFRFHMVAGNRALIVAEEFTPSASYFCPAVHFVAAPRPQLVDTILHYLTHEDQRAALAENAYNLVTHERTLRNSVADLLAQTAQAASLSPHA